mgnify:CR=1 FL=1
MTIREKTVALIDALKATCKTYGMGNDGNEYKIITQVFLYKFLNDKFGYAIKHSGNRYAEKICTAEKWETAYSELSDMERMMLLASLSPDLPRLKPEHLIANLWNQQAKGDFDFIFDNTMSDIAEQNLAIFSTQTTQNTKIPLFEPLTQYVTDVAQRAEHHLHVPWWISLPISLLRKPFQSITTSLPISLNISSKTTTQLEAENMQNITLLMPLLPLWLDY